MITRELGAMRARIDQLEAELATFRFSEDETPAPHVEPAHAEPAHAEPSRFPPPIPMRDLHREEPLPLAEPAEVFATDAGLREGTRAELRARLRELSSVIDSAFPEAPAPTRTKGRRP